jgi:hypothetical protein
MKTKIVLAAAIALLASRSTFAQEIPNCVRGTLASYIALGAGGCMFNSALYRDFTYVVPASNTITPEEIIVTPATLPIATAPFQGLNFRAPWSAAAGGSEVSIIDYNVVPFPPGASPVPSSTVLTLDLGTSEVSGVIGSVTVQEQVTTDALPASTATLEVYDICSAAAVCTIKSTDSVTFTPLSTLETTLTVTITGGSGGASLNNFASNEAFGVEPE